MCPWTTRDTARSLVKAGGEARKGEESAKVRGGQRACSEREEGVGRMEGGRAVIPRIWGETEESAECLSEGRGMQREVGGGRRGYRGSGLARRTRESGGVEVRLGSGVRTFRENGRVWEWKREATSSSIE